MRKCWRSILSLLLVVVFVLELFPASSFAVEASAEQPAEAEAAEISAAAEAVTEDGEAYVIILTAS